MKNDQPMQEPEIIPITEEPIKGIDDKKAVMKPPKDIKLSLSKSVMSPEQILAIRAGTPKQFIKEFKGRGGKMLSYVPVAIYIRKLNFVFGYGNWSFEIIKSDILEGQAVVQGKLTVPGFNLSVGQFGGHPIAREKETGKAVDVGDALKAAASDCLKKCTSMIGMFADVYSPSDFIEIKPDEGPAAISDDSEANVVSILEIVKKSKAADMKKIAEKIRTSKKYSAEQKKRIITAIDDRMRGLSDGEPVG